MNRVQRLRALPYRTRLAVVVAAGLLGLIGTLAVPAFPQPEWYHDFADKRLIWGVANYFDVVSNAGFAAVGLAGLGFLASAGGRAALADVAARTAYLSFFAGLLLVAAGSAYYHLAPTTESLYWDRLGMSVAFMAFYAAVIGERVHRRAGLWLLPVFVVAGALATTAWSYSEAAGAGDLRIYLLVQVVPALTLPLIVLLFAAPAGGDRHLVAMLALYATAFVLEKLDGPVFSLLGGLVSGHSLKHLAAAAACYAVLVMLIRRRT
ncbi:MAG: alkaline phytoceramidase [Alphaproteobacteria bacterium]|jgi:hypothetical protein|nr:alkaline phytoceramidase [Alphaproteobacteria bacterium]